MGGIPDRLVKNGSRGVDKIIEKQKKKTRVKIKVSLVVFLLLMLGLLVKYQDEILNY